MGHAPSTVMQVMLLVLVVLPGITYQFLRERSRGPVPGERDLGERVLRAVGASLLLDALYLLVAGPQLVRWARESATGGWDGFGHQPRQAALLGLVLLVGVPAAAAAAVSWWERGRRPAVRYRSTPTAWDRMFHGRGSCFVRMRMRDGSWVGGWYGSRSFVTSYPQPPEVYLESAWLMRPDGSFVRPIAGSAGLHVRAAETDLLELLLPPSVPEPDPGPGDPDGRTPAPHTPAPHTPGSEPS
ncbi:DUF6338 family protein [Streptomyces sp. NPDC006649]|uniref:DUF6338 family protein n=1 Tax=Streptomyces sp. NPDC006649 TaxID=3156896 RepID=UPI0033AC6CCB